MTENLEIKNGLTYSIVNGVNMGLKSGLYKEYFENGNLAYIAEYKDGLLDGDTFRYYKNGRTAIKENYQNGRLEKHAEFDKYGYVKFGMETSGPNEQTCWYSLRGEVISAGIMKNNLKEGKWMDSQPDSSVYIKNYKHGILNGSYQLVRFNNVLEKGYYKDGKLDGIRKIFNLDDGTKVEIKYQKGKMIYEKFYDSKGRISHITKY